MATYTIGNYSVRKMPTKNIVNRAFGNIMMILKIFGLLPYDSWPEIYKIYAYTLYFIFTFLISIASILYLCTSEVTNLSENAGSVCLIIELAINTVKQLPLKMHPEIIKNTIYTLESDIFTSYLPEQEYIMEETIYMSRMAFNIFFCCGNIATYFWQVPVILSKKLPIDVWIPYDPYQNLVVYWTTFLWIFLGGKYDEIYFSLFSFA